MSYQPAKTYDESGASRVGTDAFVSSITYEYPVTSSSKEIPEVSTA